MRPVVAPLPRFVFHFAFSCACACVLPHVARAGWTANGVPVSPSDFDQADVALVADGVGGAIVAWAQPLDASSYGTPVARLDAGGTMVPGFPAIAWTGGAPFHDLALAADGTGGAYIAADLTSLFLRLLRIHGDGSIPAGWGTGIHLMYASDSAPAGSLAGGARTLRTQNGWLPMLAPDGTGGVIAGWTAETGGANDIARATRIAADATFVPGWGSHGGAAGLPGYYTDHTSVCADPAGGVWVSYASWTASTPRVVVGHVPPNGATTAVSFASSDATDSQDGSTVVPDGSGGAFVVWLHQGPSAVPEVRAQHLLADGTYAGGWPAAGLVVCSSPTEAGTIAHFDATYAFYRESAVPDGAGGLYVAWTDHRASATDGDVYAQHVLGDGTLAPGWPVDGLAVCTAAGDQRQPVAAADGQGGLLLAWQDARGADRDITVQRLDAAGNAAPNWPAGGLPLCTATGDQVEPRIVTDGAAGAIVAWTDGRGPRTQVYAARVTYDAAVAVLAALVRGEYSDDAIRLAWQVTPGATVRLERRTASTGWLPHATLAAGGDGTVAYADRDVVPGERYGYRLVLGAGAVAGEAWIEAPAGARPAFAIDVPAPNPARGAARVTFTLPDGAAARLEVFDVRGRRVYAEDVGARGAGGHVAALPAFAPGLYVVRLTRAGRAVSSRLAVIR